MRLGKSHSAGHILCANKSQIYPAIKTFHGKANKFLSKRHCALREIRNIIPLPYCAIATHQKLRTVTRRRYRYNVKLYGILIAVRFAQFFVIHC